MDNEYAKLQYIDVKIADQNNSNVKVVSGLSDSGAEISVLRADVLGQLEVPHVGKLKLRGIVGSPVSADLVKLKIALSVPEHNDSDYVTIMCAVCPEANDDLVLTADVVNSLFAKQSQVSNVNVDTKLDASYDDHDDCNDGSDIETH